MHAGSVCLYDGPVYFPFWGMGQCGLSAVNRTDLRALSAPDGINWISLSSGTENDGQESFIIPATAALASDWNFYVDVVDFIRNYADRFHHAKEEDILFVEYHVNIFLKEEQFFSYPPQMMMKIDHLSASLRIVIIICLHLSA